MEWIAQMKVDSLPRGRNQPFYQVASATGGHHCRNVLQAFMDGWLIVAVRCRRGKHRAYDADSKANRGYLGLVSEPGHVLLACRIWL